MLKNFIKVAFRNLWRSKGFSAINVVGLAIGMTGAVIILLWIQNEVSFDRFHEKGSRIYEVFNLASVGQSSAGQSNKKPTERIASRMNDTFRTTNAQKLRVHQF